MRRYRTRPVPGLRSGEDRLSRCDRWHVWTPFATYNPLVPDAELSRGSFGELTLATFVERLASGEPVPGGGSASAVAAALGAGLVAMVASLSQGRPKYAGHTDLHARAIETGRRLSARFIELADDDSNAYATFAETLKLPRETDEEKDRRRAAMAAAARDAAEVPLAVAEACLELVATAEALVGRSNANASSDLNVSALLAEAAARGAVENVLVNLPTVNDDAYQTETTSRAMKLLDNIEEIAAVVHEGVKTGAARDPISA